MIDYRDAVLDDGAELSQLAARSFTEAFGTLYPASDLHAFLNETFGRGLPSHLRDPAYRVRLAVEDGKIVGFAKIGPVLFPGDWGEDTIELHQLYVLGGWQGSGVGGELMDWAIECAREAGKNRMVLSVYVDNIRAQRFYTRYGFEEVGAYEFRVGETIDDDRIWSRAL
ncbi:GNAT family N-acetyltransferase [Stakelama sp. CBK3Z-3]|uniref:GNAT family N-acetyltransferase n=1 Tax=Stakelama flava TaxID=2860338 RepID=A0ABS6XL88_9SPHN|nr:GNAT family N-acetyltransferase [Stakelama flava]MBW4330978.1 GNAT family N-acetyltransferase [Stakelama flava]